MIWNQVTKSHLSTSNILGILPFRQQLAKGRAQCWRFCSLFAVSLTWYAFPLPLVPTDQFLCVSSHGLYNGQEGMAGLLSCRQPKTRWYLRKGRAHAPETLTMFWVFLSSEMFVLKPWAFGDVSWWPGSAPDSANARSWNDSCIWFHLPILCRMSPRKIFLLCWEVTQKQWRAKDLERSWRGKVCFVAVILFWMTWHLRIENWNRHYSWLLACLPWETAQLI